MSEASGTTIESNRKGPRSDTLAASVLLLLGVTIGQRAIGLGRNILFCGLLEDSELGRWSLSFNFLIVAAPLVVLGLPGSFGRYAEYYRQRGQLRSFLRRTALATAVATGLATLVGIVWPEPLSHLLYGDAESIGLVRLLVTTLAAVIVFNFTVELFTALRLVRYASLLQFVSSVGFAGVGLVLLLATPMRESAVIIAYGAASLMALTLGGWLMFGVWRDSSVASEPLPKVAFWEKLLPFAGWIWLSNLVGNLFEVADQFMLKHFSGLDASAADALVGQYYSSRIIPLLLLSMASMVASSLLPHLARDWESGKRGLVAQRMKLCVKLGVIFFTLASAAVLLAAPILYGWALGGRYDTGLTVLPGTLLYCVWGCVSALALCYLLCAESARLGSLALFCGLVLNIVLNYLLAPRFDLVGVVAATCTANAVSLTLICYLSRWQGMRWDWGSVVAALLPICLLLGGPAALAILLIVALCGHQWIFSKSEREELYGYIGVVADRAFQKLPVQLMRPFGIG